MHFKAFSESLSEWILCEWTYPMHPKTCGDNPFHNLIAGYKFSNISIGLLPHIVLDGRRLIRCVAFITQNSINDLVGLTKLLRFDLYS